MYRKGHIGLGLLSYAPIAYGLTTMGLYAELLIGIPCVIFFSIAPDFDRWLPIVSHRGITHTILCGLVASFSVTVLSVYLYDVLSIDAIGLTSVELVAGVIFFGSLIGVFSHLAGDVLTPSGVAPFAPLSGRTYTLDLVYSNSRRANAFFSVIGTVAIVAAISSGVLIHQGVVQLEVSLPPLL